MFVEAWIRNAFDTQYIPIAFQYDRSLAPSGFIGEMGRPRTFGVNVGVSFWDRSGSVSVAHVGRSLSAFAGLRLDRSRRFRVLLDPPVNAIMKHRIAIAFAILITTVALTTGSGAGGRRLAAVEGTGSVRHLVAKQACSRSGPSQDPRRSGPHRPSATALAPSPSAATASSCRGCGIVRASSPASIGPMASWSGRRRSAPAGDNDRGSGPRSTPTTDGDRLYVLTENGDLACLRSAGRHRRLAAEHPHRLSRLAISTG